MYWTKEPGPIPSTKGDLLKALESSTAVNSELPLKSLNKEELKHLFRTQVQGVRSSSDPTVGMSGLTRPELLAKLEDHGVNIPETGPKKPTRGALMAALREHWVDQCNLAKMKDENHECGSVTSWLLMEPAAMESPNLDIAVEDASESIARMVETTRCVFDMMSEACDPDVQQAIDTCLQSRNALVAAFEELISKNR